jgi:hypothetical protein
MPKNNNIMIKIHNMPFSIALPASTVTFSCSVTRLREVLGLAAASNSEIKIAMNKMGNQFVPRHRGPKGTSHMPPAHEKSDTTKKNHKKLFQGPLVPKTKETNQTIKNPKARATNRSAMNMSFSFLF